MSLIIAGIETEEVGWWLWSAAPPRPAEKHGHGRLHLIIWRVRGSCDTDRRLPLMPPWTTRERGEGARVDRWQDRLNLLTVTQCWTDTCGDGQIPNKMSGVGLWQNV